MAAPAPSRSAFRLLILLAVLFALIGTLVLLVPSTSALHDVALVLWGAVPVAVALWDFAYHRIETHRLRVNRLRFWLTNPESAWGMTAEFETRMRLEAAMTLAGEAVTPLLVAPDARLSHTSGESVWHIRGMTVRISAEVASNPYEGDKNIIRVEFPIMHRSYRSWSDVIRDTVTVVADRIDSAVEPLSRKFVVQVGFPGKNPYFGLFVTDIGLHAVTRFELDYWEQRAHERDLVRVKKDRMELITETMYAARELSLYYLALHGVEG